MNSESSVEEQERSRWHRIPRFHVIYEVDRSDIDGKDPQRPLFKQFIPVQIDTQYHGKQIDHVNCLGESMICH